MQDRERDGCRLGQLLIVNLIRLQVRHFKALWERVHIKAEWPVAVSPDQQAARLRPDIHLWLDNAHHRLRRRHHGQGRRDEGLMAYRDGPNVETQVLTELTGPGSGGHD